MTIPFLPAAAPSPPSEPPPEPNPLAARPEFTFEVPHPLIHNWGYEIHTHKIQ